MKIFTPVFAIARLQCPFIPKGRFTDVCKLTTCIIIFILQPVLLNAQDIDSLYTVYSQEKGAEQIRPANEICALAFRREVVNEEWTFSRSDETGQIRARVLYCMSSFAAAKGDYPKAVAYIGEGLKIDEQLNDKPMVAADYRKLATIYDRLNRIGKAVSYFDKSIGISSSIGDEKNEAETLYQLGLFYLWKNRNEIGIQTIARINSGIIQMKYHWGDKKIMEDILLVKSSIIQISSVNRSMIIRSPLRPHKQLYRQIA